ncbi:MAG: hypothetical protein Q9181_003777 [Wetmoreana brouardii]
MLRDEGITPSIVSGNKSLLIETMKKALKDTIADSEPASFRTALEFQSTPPAKGSWITKSHADPSTSLLSTAPAAKGSFFSRSPPPGVDFPDLLDQGDNVDGGIQSLIEGMTVAHKLSDSPDEAGPELDMDDETPTSFWALRDVHFREIAALRTSREGITGHAAVIAFFGWQARLTICFPERAWRTAASVGPQSTAGAAAGGELAAGMHERREDGDGIGFGMEYWEF